MPMIKCTDEQAYLIELCLDAMCRATMGQLTHIIESMEQIRGKLFKVKCPDGKVSGFLPEVGEKNLRSFGYKDHIFYFDHIKPPNWS